MEQGDCNFATEQTIGIIGLGLIGGSYAKGLRRLGTAKLIAVDVDEEALQAALWEIRKEDIISCRKVT